MTREAEDCLELTHEQYVAEKVAVAMILLEAKDRDPRTATAQEALEALEAEPNYHASIEGSPEVEAFEEAWYRDRG